MHSLTPLSRPTLKARHAAPSTIVGARVSDQRANRRHSRGAAARWPADPGGPGAPALGAHAFVVSQPPRQLPYMPRQLRGASALVARVGAAGAVQGPRSGAVSVPLGQPATNAEPRSGVCTSLSIGARHSGAPAQPAQTRPHLTAVSPSPTTTGAVRRLLSVAPYCARVSGALVIGAHPVALGADRSGLPRCGAPALEHRTTRPRHTAPRRSNSSQGRNRIAP